MSRIFISYRRGDTSPYAGRLHDKLSLRFGPENVFRDIDDIRPGADFAEVITQSVGQCDATLVLIGAEWLTITDADGVRRLDQENDFVRLEVGSALAKGIPVIPVLVEDTPMPSSVDLPGPLAPLSTRNAVELTDERFDYDFEKLATALEGYLGEGESLSKLARYPRKKLVRTAASIALVVGLLTAAFVAFRGGDPDVPIPAQTSAAASTLSEEANALVAINPTACINSPDIPANETLSIASPLPGAQVSDTPTLEGRAQLAAGESVYLFTFAPGLCYYFFDPYGPVAIDADGRWAHTFDVTHNRGNDVILVATVVGPNNRALFEEVIDDFRSKGELDNSNVKRLPSGTKVARVTVRVAG